MIKFVRVFIMTICFQNDWTDSNGNLRAVPHLTTKNIAFLRTCMLLKKMGIKNYAFPLALYDPDLKDVDVYALTEDTPENEILRTKVMVESTRNGWYFLREVIKIYDQGGAPIPFRLDRGSCAMAWSFFNGIDYAGMQPRQTGKANRLDSLVRTPSGWVRMGDIKLNQIVVTPDGGTAPVVGIYPQGELPCYRIITEDERWNDCSEDHLWKIFDTQSPDKSWQVLTLREIASLIDKGHELFIPLIKPEHKPDVSLSICSNVLGALLTDEQFLRRQSVPNSSMYKDLLKLGLIDNLKDKRFIPEVYRQASPKQRLELLKGITRFSKNNGTIIETAFSTTSPIFAEQVQELVQGLGGICHITTKYTNQVLQWFFKITIETDFTKSIYETDLKLKLTEVKQIGKSVPMQCIEIDHPDHLYITDEYLVTHNTVCALSLTAWIMYSSGIQFEVGMMAKDNNLREENVKRVKSFGENLPKWWLAADKFKDKNNTQEIYYNALKNHYRTYVANSDPRKADLQARGASPPVFHFDEFEFTININISYPTIIASTGTARENARKNGKPYSNIITSTAGDPKKKECQAAAKILSGAMTFTELLYDLESNAKLHEVVEAASPQKMLMGIFSHLQLGFDNKWLRDKITRTSMSRDQVLRDYLNRRVSIQDEPIIPAHTLALINSSQVEPDHFQILSSKFVIYWYLPKDVVNSPSFKDRPIVVGCDSSEMIDRDATTLVGIDPRDLSVVFTFRCSEGNISAVGVMIAQLMLMYPKMILVPENKSSGTSIIDVVSLILRKQGHNPFLRMFNWVVNNRDEEEFARYNIRDVNLLDTSVKRFFGIKTDKAKRDQLYSTTLLEGAAKSATKIKDKTLIAELSSLTVRNGRVDHEVGGNDDSVIGWLMAVWFIMNAKHLDVYGIKPGTAMSFINPSNSDKSSIDVVRQQRIRDKIEELEDKLKHQQDPALRKLIQSDITALTSMVEHTALAIPSTIDDLTRDPRKFTDSVTAAQSLPPVNLDDMERGLKMVLGLQ